ncbi:MAG: hypothetical protein ACJ8EE_00990, partial [Bradyrhizobium sp.]
MQRTGPSILCRAGAVVLGAAPGAACGCAGVPDFCPEKTLPRKFEIPSPEDWAWASTASNTVAASMA